MAIAKKNLYAPENYQACLERIAALNPASEPQWGSMTAAQMLAHCAEILEVSNGKPLQNTPFLVKLFRGMIRRMVLDDKPYAKNLQTHPQYKQTSERNFDDEKKRLLAALQTFIAQKKQDAGSTRHPLFGEMSRQEKGWAMYKHLDHHLSQFGV